MQECYECYGKNNCFDKKVSCNKKYCYKSEIDLGSKFYARANILRMERYFKDEGWINIRMEPLRGRAHINETFINVPKLVIKSRFFNETVVAVFSRSTICLTVLRFFDEVNSSF